MNIFCGSELVFNHTYFPTECKNTLNIVTDIPIKSLISTEVSPSAGSFSYENRFIIWRADGTNLYLNEVSVERDLVGASLCINFSQSTIIPGTKLFFYKGTLLLIVPTQSGIHQFCIVLGDYSTKLNINQSILDYFCLKDSIESIHKFYHLKTNGVADKVDIDLNKSGFIVVGICMVDKQLIRLVFSSLFKDNESANEMVLQGNSRFNRIFKGKSVSSDTLDVVIGDSNDLMLFSVHRDGFIRSWNGNSQTYSSATNIADFLIEESSINIVDISLKRVELFKNELNYLILRIKTSSNTRFLILENSRSKLKMKFSCKLDTKYVIDYICTPSERKLDEFTFWVIINESFQSDQDEAYFQPYVVKQCTFSFSGKHISVWEDVQPALAHNNVDNLLFKFAESEAVKNRVFDGNNYSFSVVTRAVQVVCKLHKKQFEYNNWIALSTYVEDFLASGQFKQLFLSNEDGSSLLNYNILKDEKLKAAINQFWCNLLKCCNQLQEAEIQPLAFLQSDSLGLIGIIQQSRFTVYSPPDQHMRAICEPSNRVVKSFFEIVKPFLQEDNTLNTLNVSKTLETITNHTDELCRVIRAFAEHRPVDVSNKLIDTNSEYLASSFSTGLLAMSLRHRILARLRLADIIHKLISIVPQILAISTEARINPRLDLVINAHNSTISQIILYYSNMWIALSVRLVSQNSADTSGSKQFSVAQAFFKFGKSTLLKKMPNATQFLCNVVSSEEDEDEEMEADLEFETENVSFPRSRWDNSTFRNGELTPIATSSPFSTSLIPHQWAMGDKPFQKFIREVLAASIITLWPESTSLTLPRFLAEHGFYDALRNYCALNEPFISELAHALRFFQGISLSGLKKPEAAWKAFEEVSLGILSKDDTLNSLLKHIIPLKTQDFNETINEQPANIQKPKIHTLVEYYYKTMIIFKNHENTSLVIKAAEKAAQCAKSNDPLLIEIFTMLFNQHLLTKNYRETIRILLINPSSKRQSSCLRQLLNNLIERGETQTLVYLSYEHLTEMVVDILETRCRGEIVGTMLPNNSYDIAFAFHVTRFEFAKAAQLIYHLAQRLKHELQNRDYLEKRCRALSVVYQTLQIVDFDNAIILCEVEKNSEDFINSVNENNLPYNKELKIASGAIYNSKKNTVSLTRDDIGRELIKAEVRLELIDCDPHTVPPTDVKDLLRDALKHKRYDMAWVLIREYELSSYDLLEQVTKEGIIADNLTVKEGKKVDPKWALSNQQFVMNVKEKKLKMHWKIVISYIELALLNWPNDARILRTVTCVFLKYSMNIPDWLEILYKKVNIADFLQSYIEYGELAKAFSLILPEMDSLIGKTITGKETNVLIPFTPIFQLIHFASKLNDKTLPIEELNQKIQKYFNYFNATQQAKQSIR